MFDPRPLTSDEAATVQLHPILEPTYVGLTSLTVAPRAALACATVMSEHGGGSVTAAGIVEEAPVVDVDAPTDGAAEVVVPELLVDDVADTGVALPPQAARRVADPSTSAISRRTAARV